VHSAAEAAARTNTKKPKNAEIAWQPKTVPSNLPSSAAETTGPRSHSSSPALSGHESRVVLPFVSWSYQLHFQISSACVVIAKNAESKRPMRYVFRFLRSGERVRPRRGLGLLRSLLSLPALLLPSSSLLALWWLFLGRPGR